MAPTTSSRWVITSNASTSALRLDEDVPLPALANRQYLVRIEAVSLNYRDLAIATGRYPLPLRHTFVPSSDAAGQVIAVGPGVTDFQPGDRVCMLFMKAHQDGIITPKVRKSTLGSQSDGVLLQYGAFEETGSTLPCAAVTAWNCLFGLKGKQLRKGEFLLTQGTGGVSLFAIQFALAVGATVICTTSSLEKEEKLKNLGVQHVINYKSNPDWGEATKSLCADSFGVHHVVEVGGENTIAQSMKAIRPEGVVSLVGFLGGKLNGTPTSFSLIQQQNCIVRGINVGSRKLSQEMNDFLERTKIRPIVFEHVFDYQKAKEAYECMEQQNFWGKIVIKVNS